MEEGNYIDADDILKEITKLSIPLVVSHCLDDMLYSEGKRAYTEGKISISKDHFNRTLDFKRSEDYLLLIYCIENSLQNGYDARSYYSKLIKLLEFENTSQIIMKNQSTALLFLTGRWEGGSYYFEIQEGENNHSTYNLPHKNREGYYVINNGIYSVETTNYFKFKILDDKTISIYCYQDKSTHILYKDSR